MAGKIIGAAIVAVGKRSVLVNELHSTKGWRGLREVPLRFFPWAPIAGTFSRRPNNKQRDPSDPGRLMRNRRPFAGEPDEKAKLRHAWYRKQKFWEAVRASLPEENRL